MLARLMHTLKMPEDELHELRKIMEEPHALREAGLPELEQRSVRAVHLQTHFWMRHQTDVVQAHHGTRPGDPFADIVFSYVWARVLHCLQHFMKQHDLLSTFPRLNQLSLFEQIDYGPLPTADFVGPTWMDDLAICLQGHTGRSCTKGWNGRQSTIRALYRAWHDAESFQEQDGSASLFSWLQIPKAEEESLLWSTCNGLFASCNRVWHDADAFDYKLRPSWRTSSSRL